MLNGGINIKIKKKDFFFKAGSIYVSISIFVSQLDYIIFRFLKKVIKFHYWIKILFLIFMCKWLEFLSGVNCFLDIKNIDDGFFFFFLLIQAIKAIPEP